MLNGNVGIVHLLVGLKNQIYKSESVFSLTIWIM